jgi:hypothetical protein
MAEYINETNRKARTEPRMPHIKMVDPAGFVCNVVTSNSTDRDPRTGQYVYHPTKNVYGSSIIEERRLRGWLFYEGCPLSYAGIAAQPGEQACEGPWPCKHVKDAIASRQRDHAKREAKAAVEHESKAEREMQERHQATLEAIRDGQNNQATQALSNELAALKAELAALKKPKRRRTKKAKPTDE